MESHAECMCRFDENHQEIGCFFKYVIFLLKRFVSSLDLLVTHPKDAQKEMLKNDIWIQIATQYDGYFTDCETDSACVDGCVLKLLQKSAENQLKILASGRHVDGSRNENEMNLDRYRLEGQSSDESDKLPDLTHISLLLELIVANPPLFDQTHPSFGDDKFKFRIWNEICTAWYRRDQNYCADFKFQCRFAEQMLYRISNPLNVNRKTVADKHDNNLSDEVSATTDKNLSQLVCDMFSNSSEPATLHIKNVEKLYIVTNTKKTDETPPPPPPTNDDAPLNEKKKRNRRYNRYNRNKNAGDQSNQPVAEHP